MNKQFRSVTIPKYLPTLSLVVSGALYCASPAFAFGELYQGVEDPCTTFTTCTPAVYSHAYADTWITFSPRVVAPSQFAGYQLPTGMVQGLNVARDENFLHTTASVSATTGVGCINCVIFGLTPPASPASARAQSDFGINRALGYTSVGIEGDHVVSGTSSAHVQILTTGSANSMWRDVWTFDADGHFNALIKLDGRSSTETTNLSFPSPSTFSYDTKNPLSEWYYNIKVWDVDHLSRDSDGIFGPTLVANLQDPTGFDEKRSSFASTLALDFNFTSGVQYVAIAELGVNAHNGREIDVYNTARLIDVTLSNGATLSALSGHNYVSSVPVPATEWLFGSGLLGLVGVARRKKTRAINSFHPKTAAH